MSIYAFDFRDQLYGPWETARSALIDQLDLLYAGLNANTIGRDTNGHITTIGGVPITVDVTNISSGGSAANNWGTSTNLNAITTGIQQGVSPTTTAIQLASVSISNAQVLAGTTIANVVSATGGMLVPLYGVIHTVYPTLGYNSAQSISLRYHGRTDNVITWTGAIVNGLGAVNTYFLSELNTNQSFATVSGTPKNVGLDVAFSAGNNSGDPLNTFTLIFAYQSLSI